MKISAAGKFWFALLLLVSSLSSSPMASMEQSVVTVVGQVAHAHPLPPVRIGTAAEMAGHSVAPERPDSPRAPPLLPFVPVSVTLTRTGPSGGSASPLRPLDPAAVTPLCERLPYHPNAPPA